VVYVDEEGGFYQVLVALDPSCKPPHNGTINWKMDDKGNIERKIIKAKERLRVFKTRA
jgi:hypothetical protein